jgi:hypothetical protein
VKVTGHIPYRHIFLGFILLAVVITLPHHTSAQSVPLFLPAVTYSSGGSTPSSVAIADLNGDSKPDLVVANLLGENNHGSLGVLLGAGDGTFSAAVTYDSGGLSAYSVKVVDLNGDHKMDLVVANGTGVGVLLGNGDGTFQPAVTYPSGGFGAQSVDVGDVNGDGMADIVVGNNNASSTNPEGSVAVLVGRGDGTFRYAAAYDSGGESANSVALRDVNGDGKLDLLLSNECSNPDNCKRGVLGVLVGHGDGTFQPVVTYDSGGYSASSLTVADVNGDGKPDMIAYNGCNTIGFNGCTSTVAAVLLGNGDGTFQNAVSYNSGGAGGNNGSVVVADVNANGKQDLVDVNWGASGSGRVGVLLGDGDGIFQAAVDYDSGGSNPLALAIADLNGDGLLDVVVAECAVNACENGDLVGVLLNNAKSVKVPTSTLLSSSLNPSIYGQNVTFTAKVANNSSIAPTGRVIFKWGPYSIGSALLSSNGVATVSKSNLNADNYPLTAAYVGDSADLKSTSTVVNQVVEQAKSRTAITSSLNPSLAGQPVTFHVTVVSPTVLPTGPVTFKAGTTVLGTAQLSHNQAQFTTSSLPVGSTKITVIYFGDSNISKSSASVTQNVQ